MVDEAPTSRHLLSSRGSHAATHSVPAVQENFIVCPSVSPA